MTNFMQNNLGKSSSPYLLQHKDNPVHWQEWNEDTLNFAKESGMLILVSIGYATCHWCHVMANEAFSDTETADYINENFVSIKVDREQRPDIDEYFMSFVIDTIGHGGWPLNVVMSHDGKPFFGGTYFPHIAKYGSRPFKEILQEITRWYSENGDSISGYEITDNEIFLNNIEETAMVHSIYEAFDHEFSGFGTQEKFPPYNTILFLLYYFQETKSLSEKEIIIKTIDAMSKRGLHDHLQGGFYRYCVNRVWEIPHFEKMLYDQAMQLMVYSLSFQMFRRNEDKIVVVKIVKCLQETFSDNNGLFYSGHDADTDHMEGTTYVWGEDELKDILSEDEFKLFAEEYEVTDEGNFEGKNHLVKKTRGDEKTNKDNAIIVNNIEAKLLAQRKRRIQPFIDKKILTSWNALTGIGLIFAWRYIGNDEFRKMGFRVFEKILKRHYSGGILAHSSLDNVMQKQEFLEDHAALLLLTTYLYEDVQDDAEKEIFRMHIENFLNGLSFFKIEEKNSTKWFANRNGSDFRQIPAKTFDHPTPSAISLAELAVFRSHKILQKGEQLLQYKHPLGNDFHNLAAFFTMGRFHEIHAPEKIDWPELPINSLLLKDTKYQDCTGFTCNEFADRRALLDYLKLTKK